MDFSENQTVANQIIQAHAFGDEISAKQVVSQIGAGCTIEIIDDFGLY
jgi:hypothetical protein